MTIYISYSQQDEAFANNLAAVLKKRGYDIWIDTQNLNPSDVWAEQINQAIVQAEILIALLSPSSVTSRTNLHEIELAESLRKPIIPVLVSPTQIPPSLASRQYLDGTQEWDLFVKKLIYAIEANTEIGRQRKTSVSASRKVNAASQTQGRRSKFLLPILVLVAILLITIALIVILPIQRLNAPPVTDTSGNTSQQNGTLAPTPTPIRLVKMVQALQNLPSGYQFPSSIQELENIAGYVLWPEEVTPFNAIKETDGGLEQLLGKYTRTDIYREQPILSTFITGKNQILLDMTAAPTELARQATQIALQNGNISTTFVPSSTPKSTELVSTILVPTITPVKATAQPVQASASPDMNATQVAFQVQATLVAFRATEQNILSPAEAAQIMNTSGNTARLDLAALVIAALALGGTLTLLFFYRTGNYQSGRRTSHPAAHPNLAAPPSLPEKLLEEYQIFISSSEKDKEWVNILVQDLLALDYLVWWYVKDAPGLPFGNEIRSAIFHTKVFVIILSPDSMKSKHIEEEIRWAEIYDRPIIPVVCRSISVEERLYGLAKGADINFSNEAEYKHSLELLTQAVDHYLKKRLEPIQGTTATNT